jgi:hypothetical protein
LDSNFLGSLDVRYCKANLIGFSAAMVLWTLYRQAKEKKQARGDVKEYLQKVCTSIVVTWGVNIVHGHKPLLALGLFLFVLWNYETYPIFHLGFWLS